MRKLELISDVRYFWFHSIWFGLSTYIYPARFERKSKNGKKGRTFKKSERIGCIKFKKLAYVKQNIFSKQAYFGVTSPTVHCILPAEHIKFKIPGTVFYQNALPNLLILFQSHLQKTEGLEKEGMTEWAQKDSCWWPFAWTLLDMQYESAGTHSYMQYGTVIFITL